jgi:hypothetical protein
MKITDVYWSTAHKPGDVVPYILNIQEPSPLLAELKNLSKQLEGEASAKSGSFLLCPSMLEVTKNTFVVKSPIDFSIKYDGSAIYTTLPDKTYLINRNPSAGFVSLNFIQLILFSDADSVNMRVRNAYYSNNSFVNNCSVLEGAFDIAKWFRVIDCAIFFKSPTSIDVKQGDALFYIEFDTSVKFKKFLFNDELSKCSFYCMASKNFNKLSVSNYFEAIYSLFAKSKIKTHILKLIKNNLL